MNDVAVIIPVFRDKRGEDENRAIKHLEYYLSEFDRIIVKPESLQLDWPCYQSESFDNSFFDSVSSYSKLLLSRHFYRTFNRYEYILIYQLDCLVFSNELMKYCAMGYDYIGAPLFKKKHDVSKGFSRIGNGGLSLRNIDAFLRVLSSKRKPQVIDMLDGKMPEIPKTNVIKRLKVLNSCRKGIDRYISNYSLNEDRFWSDRARIFDSGFKIAPIKDGLKFAFEQFPRYCFKNNNFRLPLGAHAWTKWDRDFWEPYLIK